MTQPDEPTAPDMAGFLTQLAERTRHIHHDTLFKGTFDTLDRYPFAAQFLLTALGHLESAAASFRLAALSIKASEEEAR